MTTELAIEILKTLKNTSTMPKNEDEIKLSLALDIALDMAIKSLEQEPCEDAISRERVLYEAIYYADRPTDTFIKDVLKQLPSVQPTRPKGEWIDANEKLPDTNIHVLAQFYMGGMAEVYHAHNYWHIVGGARISFDEVIAWMPLPERYERGADDED